jgi:hypothetical protein
LVSGRAFNQILTLRAWPNQTPLRTGVGEHLDRDEGSQVQILPLRPALRRNQNVYRHRLRHRFERSIGSGANPHGRRCPKVGRLADCERDTAAHVRVATHPRFPSWCCAMQEPNRASDYESGGREFESLRARQKSNKYLNNLTARKYAMQNKIICMASAWPRGAWAIGPGRAVAAAQTLLSIQCVEALYFLPQHWSPLTLRSQGMSSGK